MQRTGESVGETRNGERQGKIRERGTERMEVGADGVPLGVIPCVKEQGGSSFACWVSRGFDELNIM